MFRLFAPALLGAALWVQPAAAYEPCDRGDRVFDVVNDGHVRQRIVDAAVEEWRRFGFQVLDLSTSEWDADLSPLIGFRVPLGETPPGLIGQPKGRLMRIGFAENDYEAMDAVRGYWTSVVQDQAAVAGISLSSTPWSAAFVSWVMCRAGFNEAQFRRRDAHVHYVAAAFTEEAAYGDTAQNLYAYVARPVEHTPVRPGDLACYAHVPTSFEQRRAISLSGGDISAPTHCDIIVGFSSDGARVLAIGGNIEQSVTMSVVAGRRDGDNIYLQTQAQWPAARPYYAVMQLRARPDLANTATIRYARAELAAATPAPEPPYRDAASSAPTQGAIGPSAVGTWAGTITLASGARLTQQWTFRADGTYAGAREYGTWSQAGDVVSWTNDAGTTFSATISGNALSGATYFADATPRGSFTATRQ